MRPHSAVGQIPQLGPVAAATLAGMALLSVGLLRLAAPIGAGGQHTRRHIQLTHGLMVAMGCLLLALAMHWYRTMR